jgi:hypothetical protein
VSDPYWNTTICINCNDLSFIEKHNNWQPGLPLTITLSNSQSGWTIINTSPTRFFCERAKSVNRLRLSALAMELGCDAFYFGVYDSVLGILLEVDVQGQTFISGSPDGGFEVDNFYGEQINKPELPCDFYRLQVPEAFQKAMQANQEPELLRKQAEYDAEEQRQIDEACRLYEENPDLPPVIIEPPDDYDYKGYCQRIDEALQDAIGCLSRHDITDPELSDRSGVESIELYFQLPDTYEPQQMYVLTQAQLAEIQGVTENEIMEPEISDVYWNDTVCINCNDLSFIEKHITHLLEQEGCRRLNQIFQVPNSERRPNNWQPGSPLTITLSKSQSGWTVLNTSPTRFFCERAKSINRLRLSVLAMELGCDAFYFGVYDRLLGILLEVDAQGQTFISGSPDVRVKVHTFYGEQINDPELASDFHRLQVPEAFQKAMQANQEPELLRKQAEWWNFSDLYDDEDFQKGHSERIDEALQDAIGCLNRYDITDLEIGHRSGVESIKLYFQLPDGYQPQQMYADD